MAKEINLVPDIKNEMIVALKRRNLILFICIAVSAASLGVVVFLGTIIGGQQLALGAKAGMLKEMSEKVNSYSDLSDFLTIKNQLDKLGTISGEKRLPSRIFGVVASMMPSAPDTIKISELGVDWSSPDAPKLRIEARANAGRTPFIDYNVLDAFKKSMPYLRYDHGRYVDKLGEKIPAYCMIETGNDGATLADAEKGIYAYWMIDEAGCNPSAGQMKTEEEKWREDKKREEEEKEKEEKEEGEGESEVEVEDKSGPDMSKGHFASEYTYEEYDGKQVVRIWRTPQYNDWRKDDKMSLDGEIKDVAHFDSACIKYKGTEEGDTVKWVENNEECQLVPKGTDGITVVDSTNAKLDDELVLNFSALIDLSAEVFMAKNKHVVAIAPSGRYNVTDSYLQIQAMFSKKAERCAADDKTCNAENKGGN